MYLSLLLIIKMTSETQKSIFFLHFTKYEIVIFEMLKIKHF
jgi:hypothetical protein